MWPLLLCRFALTSAAVLLAGTAALGLLARGTGLGHVPRWQRLAWASWAVLLGASALQVWLTAAEMSGLTLSQSLSAGVLGSILDGTTFGAVSKARACLLAGGFVARCFGTLSRHDGRTRGFPALEIIDAAFAALLLVTLVWAGHAHASDRHAWLLPVDVVHALAAGAWPGGLLPLALLLASVRHAPGSLTPAVTITQRFSRLSMGAVGLLAGSGLLNAVGLVGTLPALWQSVYGRLLLCKVLLFAGMIALGAVNRRLIRRNPPVGAARTLRRLWRNVAWETALAACVLLATEALAATPPSAS